MSNVTFRSLSAVAVCLLSLALFAAPATAKSKPKPEPEPEKPSWPTKKTAGKKIGTLGKKFEASGIVWDKSMQVLWIVDDAGTLGRMKSGGSDSVTWDVSPVDKDKKRQRLDLESVTVAGTASKIYLGVESPPTILEYDASSTNDAPTATSKKWVLENLSATDNSGMEALTWVPNGYHPYTASKSGGLFYATLKKDGTIHVFDVDLSTGGAVTEVAGSSFKPNDKNDISDLYFSTDTRTLYVLYDNGSLLLAVDPSTKAPGITDSYSLKGTGPQHPEGVTLLPGCPAATATLYLADDVEGAGVFSFSDFPQACAAAK